MNAECTRCRDKFSEHIDGRLPEPERRAVDAHLAGCAECRRELETWRRTLRAVAEMPVRRARAGFARGVMERLRAGETAPQPRLVYLLWSRVLPVAAMILVVAALTLSVARDGSLERPAVEGRLAMERRTPAGDYGDELSRVTVPAAAAPAGAADEKEIAAALPGQAAVATGTAGGEAGPVDTGAESTLMPAADRPAPAAEPKAMEEARAAETALAPAPAGRDAGVSWGQREEQPPALAWREVPPEMEVAALAERKVEVVQAPAPVADLGRARAAGPLRAVGAAGTGGAPRFGAALGPPPASARALKGAGGAGERLFVQVAASKPGDVAEPVQQVLTIVGRDQAALARQVVAVANEQGIQPGLELGQDTSGGTVEVYLQVPTGRYEALLRALAMLTPPAEQRLANTAAARGEFFQVALTNYVGYQNAALDAMDEHDEARRDVALSGTVAKDLRVPADASMKAIVAPHEVALAEGVGPGVPPATNAGIPAEEGPAEPVNLVVRIVRPASRE